MGQAEESVTAPCPHGRHKVGGCQRPRTLLTPIVRLRVGELNQVTTYLRYVIRTVMASNHSQDFLFAFRLHSSALGTKDLSYFRTQQEEILAKEVKTPDSLKAIAARWRIKYLNSMEDTKSYPLYEACFPFLLRRSGTELIVFQPRFNFATSLGRATNTARISSGNTSTRQILDMEPECTPHSIQSGNGSCA